MNIFSFNVKLSCDLDIAAQSEAEAERFIASAVDAINSTLGSALPGLGAVRAIILEVDDCNGPLLIAIDGSEPSDD